MGVKLIKILFLTFISLTFALDSLNTYPKLPLKIAVIPGMGQIYNEQYLKAGALVSLEVGFSGLDRIFKLDKNQLRLIDNPLENMLFC